MTTLATPTTDPMRGTTARIALTLFAWGAVVTAAAASGLLARLWLPYIAVLVAAGIALPSLWYFTSTSARAWADRLGLRRITALHVWRVPAALLFFWYGLNAQLPPAFWILAGVGDLLAGLYAGYVVTRKAPTDGQFRAMHRFGLADFVVAVGTGLTFTFMLDPRMGLIATLPMALIPLYGVGISGASHLIALDMLRRGGGLSESPAPGSRH